MEFFKHIFSGIGYLTTTKSFWIGFIISLVFTVFGIGTSIVGFMIATIAVLCAIKEVADSNTEKEENE